MTIANNITLARLLIAEISFIFIIVNMFHVGFVLLLVAILLDIVDGKVARRMKQVSKPGIFLDIMADKIVIISAFLVVGLKINLIFFYLGLLMLLREYAMDTMRSIAASKGKVISSDKFSKIKGWLFMISVVGMLGCFTFFGSILELQNFMILVGITGMVMAYITLVRFLIIYRKLIL